jgi:hypothetical protein
MDYSWIMLIYAHPGQETLDLLRYMWLSWVLVTVLHSLA